jgi:hypothetical protein
MFGTRSAIFGVSTLAYVTASTSSLMPKHSYPISNHKVSDPGPYCDNLTYWLMARHAGKRHWEFPVMNVKICPTQPTGMDLDEHLSIMWLGFFHFLDFPGSINVCHDGGFHRLLL